jgi:cystathionine gamma-synthase
MVWSKQGGLGAQVSTSGMCSATTMLLALVPAGGHIATTTDCYRRTPQFIQYDDVWASCA